MIQDASCVRPPCTSHLVGNSCYSLSHNDIKILGIYGAPDTISLRKAAQEIGVSHAAPNRHFTSKHALLTAIAAQGFAASDGACQGRLRCQSLAREPWKKAKGGNSEIQR